MARRGLLAHLPATPDEVVEGRVWLARGRAVALGAEPGADLTEARFHERALLAEELDYRLARDDLDGLVALLDGLLVAVCRPVRPLPPPRARDLLRRAYPRLVRPREAWDR